MFSFECQRLSDFMDVSKKKRKKFVKKVHIKQLE